MVMISDKVGHNRIVIDKHHTFIVPAMIFYLTTEAISTNHASTCTSIQNNCSGQRFFIFPIGQCHCHFCMIWGFFPIAILCHCYYTKSASWLECWPEFVNIAHHCYG